MCLDIYWLLEKTEEKKPSCAGVNQSLASDKALFFLFRVLNKSYQKRKTRRKKEGGREKKIYCMKDKD